MVKKILLLAVLALALPLAAFASSTIDFTNSGGTLTGSSSGVSLSSSTLIAVNGLFGGGLIQGTNLGSVSFTTGALVSGSLSGDATFAGGGSFTTSEITPHFTSNALVIERFTGKRTSMAMTERGVRVTVQ